MNIPEGMAKLLEEYYMYKYIWTIKNLSTVFYKNQVDGSRNKSRL